MASIIRIKRSEVSGNPATLGQGELAYSALTDNGSNGGDRLYLGMGTETANNAVNHFVIGGKFFTDRLDHTAGTLTASSAIVVDASSKIDIINVDNITLDLNTISTTNTNGNLILTPNGTGLVSIKSAYTLPGADGTNGYILTTNGAGVASWTAPSSSSFTIAGNTGTDNFSTGGTLTFTGTAPIVTAVTNDTVTISASDATTITKGVASFSSTNFAVTTGAVTIKTGGVPNTALVNASVTVGTTAIDLGAAATTISGLVSVTSTGFTGALTGNASTATALATPRTIAISGPVTGTATSFNGGADITIPVTAVDLTHANISGTLPVGKGGTGTTTSTGTGNNVLSADPTFTGVPAAPTAAAGTNTTQIATTAFVATAVDNARVGLDVKDSVRVATTANITLSNTQTVDGVALAVGNRVLVKDQSTASTNGIYIVSATAWTRATDADANAEVTSGMFVFVEEGTANGDSGWVLSTDGAIVVGTTALAFSQFSGAGQIVAGNGLTKTGNTLNVGAGTGITANADNIALTGQALALHNLAANGLIVRTGADTVTNRSVTGTAARVSVSNGDGVAGNPTIDIDATYVGQTSITTLGTVTTGTWNATAITVAKGGTGLTTLTQNGILYGNAASNAGVTAASTIDGSFLRGDATGAPYWSNSIDGGTY
jgi:hypothetical protein